MSAYRRPAIVLSTLYLLSRLIPMTDLWSKYYYFHFEVAETGIWKASATISNHPLNKLGISQDLNPQKISFHCIILAYHIG